MVSGTRRRARRGGSFARHGSRAVVVRGSSQGEDFGRATVCHHADARHGRRPRLRRRTLRRRRRRSTRRSRRGSAVSPGLVKSALQKSVRRGKIGAAARAAALLLAEHPAEALRRLVVVSVEDAALHPSTPLACWLMAANAKGYGLPAEARGAMVRYAAELAACAVKDDDVADEAWIADEGGTTSEGGTTKTPMKHTADEIDPNANLATACAGLDSERGALVCALLLRAHFGGMRGDVDMLRAAALTWRRRLARDDGVARSSRRRLLGRGGARGGGDGRDARNATATGARRPGERGRDDQTRRSTRRRRFPRVAHRRGAREARRRQSRRRRSGETRARARPRSGGDASLRRVDAQQLGHE